MKTARGHYARGLKVRAVRSRMNGEAATRGSQRIAHSSTSRYAGGLNFRVRNGYGCFPTALAAFMPTLGFEPRPSMSPRGDTERLLCRCGPIPTVYNRAIQLPPELMRVVARQRQ